MECLYIKLLIDELFFWLKTDLPTSSWVWRYMIYDVVICHNNGTHVLFCTYKKIIPIRPSLKILRRYIKKVCVKHHVCVQSNHHNFWTSAVCSIYHTINDVTFFSSINFLFDISLCLRKLTFSAFILYDKMINGPK